VNAPTQKENATFYQKTETALLCSASAWREYKRIVEETEDVSLIK